MDWRTARLAKPEGLCHIAASRIWGRFSPTERGRSSVVEHNLAKVGVESSNLFARSNFFPDIDAMNMAWPPCASSRPYPNRQFEIIA